MRILMAILLLGMLIHGLRTWLVRRPLPAVNHEPFEGTLERVNESIVACRAASSSPHRSVIAIHGFLEDFRYFTALYRDPSIELVLVNNSGYHCPVIGRSPDLASWVRQPIPTPWAASSMTPLCSIWP